MLLDRVSNPGPLTYESGALPIALRSRRRSALIATAAHRARREHKERSRSLAESRTNLHGAVMNTVDSRYIDFGYLE